MDDPVKRAEEKNEYGNRFYNQKQYANAIKAYTEAIKICPQIAKYYGNRSQCHIMCNDFVKALGDARQTIELDRGNRKGYFRIGKCCFVNGNMRYAEHILSRAKGIFPEDKEMLAMYEDVKYVQENIDQFDIKMNNEQYEEALICINKCLEKAPNCVKYITNKGKCLIYLEKYEEAEELADNVLKYKPIDEDAQFIKTKVKINQADSEVALQLSRELKKKLPDHFGTNKLYRTTSMLHNNNLEIQKALKIEKYCLAHELLTKTIKTDRTRKYFNKKLYKQKIEIAGRDPKLYWKGIEDCTNYLDIYGMDREVLKSRAQYNSYLQEYEDAVDDYKQLLKIDNTPDNKIKLKEAEKLLALQLKSEYKILKIREKATANEIRNAAKELLIHYHPDKNPKATPERKKKLEEKLIRVRRAKDRLLSNK